MDYKLENLKEKVYNGFIRGEYGEPKIPTGNEIIQKIESFTDTSYTPILEKGRIPEFNYSEISGKFSRVIDDIGVLFDSIEDESRDILDQLTSSIKEHNGVKRELRRIREKTNDIVSRRLGEDYLEYSFTESFNDVENINTIVSDPIDTDAGVFTILGSSSNLLTLPHYRDRKLEFNIIESVSSILEYGYVGETNATSILDKDDPRSITYKVRTQSPTRLKVALALQLLPDGKSTEINAVGISTDSSLTKGYIRLYYQRNFQWKDVPALSLQEIKGDTVIFSFPSVEATHIKFEFIKDYPDVPNTNEYIITINEIAISKSTNKHEAKLYSKPIIIEQYSTETPVVNTVSCVIDADIPDGCSAKVYVAQDLLLSGQFVDANNEPVLSDSLEAVSFDPFGSGSVYLSDIMLREGISGLDPYREFDFSWKELKPGESFGDAVPDIIEFNSSTDHKPIINSLYEVDWYNFNDSDYTGPWPQYPSYGTIFISGWCNSDNSQWIPFLSGAVYSGWFVSGVDVATASGIAYEDIEDSSGNVNPIILNSPTYSGQWLGYGRGYPFNYFIEDSNRYWRFGDYTQCINGWWRPMSVAILPEGVSSEFGSGWYLDNDMFGQSIPDFYFNGIKFYKIYKFGVTQNVIDSSIKLYSYETRPVDLDSDFYDHNFVWNYKSNWSIETGTSLDAKDLPHADDENFSRYVLNLPAIVSSNEEYIIDGIKDVKIHNTNVSFIKNIDYIVRTDSGGRPSGIQLYPLNYNYPYLRPSGTSFDLTYNYRVKNRYLSTWTSFAIVNPNVIGTVTIKNPKLWTKVTTTSTQDTQKRIIDKILVEDLDVGTTFEVKDKDGKLDFSLDASRSTTEKHFKVTIFCACDEETGFSARSTSSHGTHFVPSERRGLLNVSRGVRFVSKLEHLKIVDISSLIYDTPMANDKRCALITDYNNEKYLVAKSPSKDIFQGYYFDTISGCYFTDSRYFIKNTGHFVRQGIFNNETKFYTTGSSGNTILTPWNETDSSWNGGEIIPEFPNTATATSYPNHSTYGYPITLEDSANLLWRDMLTSGSFDLRAPNRDWARVGSPEWESWIQNSEYSGDAVTYSGSTSYYTQPTVTVEGTIANRGYLFYNTGENLPSFYSVTYRTVKNIDSSYSRFVYKLELSSASDRSVVPKVRSVSFRVNGAE